MAAPPERLTLVSSSVNKAIEAERILGRPLVRVAIDLPEIQAAGVETIVRAKLQAARERVPGPVIVEDVALGFNALGNFPGPYVRWMLEAAGGKCLTVIASALDDRTARAQCCIGYWDGAEVFTFLGETPGEILVHPRGARNFGWDPWFVPAGSARSFGEMADEEKDAVSHRGKAYRLLARHLLR